MHGEFITSWVTASSVITAKAARVVGVATGNVGVGALTDRARIRATLSIKKLLTSSAVCGMTGSGSVRPNVALSDRHSLIIPFHHKGKSASPARSQTPSST